MHSGDGINQMVYNRCVGTRYCSNNCPYKVRRFNFLSVLGLGNAKPVRRAQSQRHRAQPRRDGKVHVLHPAHQRGQDQSEKQNRRIADGEITPACAQACPTQAIVFGDINDPKSRVAQLKAQARNYSLLEDLNMRPRTTYLGRLRNPNPEIEKPSLKTDELDESNRPRARTKSSAPGFNYATVTDKIAGVVLKPIQTTPKQWWIGLFLRRLARACLPRRFWLFYKGVGVWGIVIPVAWGFAIVNFVWWIGIGHAGTLISAILLLC